MEKIKKAVILLAGYGTRCLPFSKVLPKAMMPILNKPIIHYIVEEIEKTEFSNSLSDEIKRIKNLSNNKKISLRSEIERLENELSKLKKSFIGNSFNDEFILNQQISDISKKLNKLKENEFLEKTKISKYEAEQINKINDKIKFFGVELLNFMIYFEVR